MKIVVSNSQVAHLWANQSQELARSGSMSFQGLNLYSYSTCIAALHRVTVGSTGRTGIALLNCRKYSATTSGRHMPAVRRALHGLAYTMLSVPEVHNDSADFPERSLSDREHTINQSYLSAEYKTFAAKLMRAQSLRDWQRQQLMELDHAQTLYANAFGLKTDGQIHWLTDWDMAQARQTRLASDPKRQARIAAREAAQRAKDARRALADYQRNHGALTAFRAGSSSYGYLVAIDGSAYLRVSADGQAVQTSRGASVPATEAIRAISFIRAVKYLRMSDWARNGEQCPVGQFQIDRIAANGDIHAGCHFIKWDEVEATAKALGMVGVQLSIGPLGTQALTVQS